jgi:hypothetical protein
VNEQGFHSIRSLVRDSILLADVCMLCKWAFRVGTEAEADFSAETAPEDFRIERAKAWIRS